MFISIIVPHSNTSIENDPLLPTLASIADQEGVQTELLLQHGGGITGLWGKLSRVLTLSAKKETITLRVIEEKNFSPEESLAAAIKRATATWIGFLQPGEQYLPNALTALQSSFQAHPEIDLFFTSSITSIDNKPIVTPATLPTYNYLTSVQPSWPQHSFFCRTSLLRDEFVLEPRYQHQMITEWLVRLLNAGKKIKTLPIFTTVATHKEQKKETLLPKPTGMTSLLKPWHQWRHQTTLRQAQKNITLPSPVLIYQHGSLTQRTNLM